MFIEIMAWTVIVYGAVPVILTLLSLEAGRHARNQRHGRAMPIAEAWPDLRGFLPLVVTRNYLLAFAATIPLVTYQWKADTAGWWLMHVPVLAAGVVCAEAVLQYLIRRKPGGPTAEPS